MLIESSRRVTNGDDTCQILVRVEYKIVRPVSHFKFSQPLEKFLHIRDRESHHENRIYSSKKLCPKLEMHRWTQNDCFLSF
jgi:hypothetical protein